MTASEADGAIQRLKAMFPNVREGQEGKWREWLLPIERDIVERAIGRHAEAANELDRSFFLREIKQECRVRNPKVPRGDPRDDPSHPRTPEGDERLRAFARQILKDVFHRAPKVDPQSAEELSPALPASHGQASS